MKNVIQKCTDRKFQQPKLRLKSGSTIKSSLVQQTTSPETQKTEIIKCSILSNCQSIISNKLDNKSLVKQNSDNQKHQKINTLNSNLNEHTALLKINYEDSDTVNQKYMYQNDQYQIEKIQDSNNASQISVDSDDDDGEDLEEENQQNNQQITNISITTSLNQIQSDQSSLNQQKQIILDQGPKLYLQQSIYEKRPATIFFPYPKCCKLERPKIRCIEATKEEQKAFDLKYKIHSQGYLCVKHALATAGLQQSNSNLDWNIIWGLGGRNKIKLMHKFQKTNHYPGCYNLGRKDCLWRNLARVKRKFAQDYAFVPNTYLLAHQQDWERFLIQREQAKKDHLWIMKPVAQACGRGVRMISKKSKVKKRQNYLICEYITNPHLIDGLKYDLRIYVLVSCYDPLRIYMYDEGLARFATEKYTTDTTQLSKRYVHLTNFSVNKNAPQFVKNKDATKDDFGSKWSLSALKKRLIEQGIAVDKIFQNIKDIVIKTLISAEPFMQDVFQRSQEHRNNCFELYGFDILIDEHFKPWLLEVNVTPSLSSSSPLDRRIKHMLLSDIFHLVGLKPYDRKILEQDKHERNSLLNYNTSKNNEPLFYKNLKEVQDLNADNCINKLTPEDWEVLFDTDEEYYRKGNFERIFPIKDKNDYYLQFFDFPRYNNLIVSRWINSPVNFLENILKKNIEKN